MADFSSSDDPVLIYRSGHAKKVKRVSSFLLLALGAIGIIIGVFGHYILPVSEDVDRSAEASVQMLTRTLASSITTAFGALPAIMFSFITLSPTPAKVVMIVVGLGGTAGPIMAFASGFFGLRELATTAVYMSMQPLCIVCLVRAFVLPRPIPVLTFDGRDFGCITRDLSWHLVELQVMATALEAHQ